MEVSKETERLSALVNFLTEKIKSYTDRYAAWSDQQRRLEQDAELAKSTVLLSHYMVGLCTKIPSDAHPALAEFGNYVTAFHQDQLALPAVLRQREDEHQVEYRGLCTTRAQLEKIQDLAALLDSAAYKPDETHLRFLITQVELEEFEAFLNGEVDVALPDKKPYAEWLQDLLAPHFTDCPTEDFEPIKTAYESHTMLDPMAIKTSLNSWLTIPEWHTVIESILVGLRKNTLENYINRKHAEVKQRLVEAAKGVPMARKFNFYRNMDSPGKDRTHHPRSTMGFLAEECLTDCTAAGFTSQGRIKLGISPRACTGTDLYVKIRQGDLYPDFITLLRQAHARLTQNEKGAYRLDVHLEPAAYLGDYQRLMACSHLRALIALETEWCETIGFPAPLPDTTYETFTTLRRAAFSAMPGLPGMPVMPR